MRPGYSKARVRRVAVRSGTDYFNFSGDFRPVSLRGLDRSRRLNHGQWGRAESGTSRLENGRSARGGIGSVRSTRFSVTIQA